MDRLSETTAYFINSDFEKSSRNSRKGQTDDGKYRQQKNRQTD